MRTGLGLGAILISVAVLSGCATSRHESVATGFVTPRQPTTNTDGPAPAVGAAAPRANGRSTAMVPRRASSGTSIESADPALAAALLDESLVPSAENHLRVADEYRRLQILDAANARLIRALRKAPRMVAVHDALARLWRDWGRPQDALGAAYRAVYFDHGSAGTLNTLGTVFDALGQLEDARETYQRALLTDPTASWALNNLCYVEFRLGRAEEGRLHCEAALRVEPALAAARNNLALTYAATGDWARAAGEFRAAGGAAAAAYNLGIVHLAVGEHAAAATAFEQAIKARPNFPAAKSRARIARQRMLERK